ncbi:MAG: hypothetical protein JXB39_00745 [Deltaproteobacteria bacterium]|nr:hypothetical protein [Deltaproteobacteria bacterium]
MYGPPPDPRQVAVPAGPLDLPWPWVACLVVGVLLVLLGVWGVRRRPAWGVLALVSGHVIALTAPAAAVLDRYVWGAWPTLDKAGSYLFYREGVHRTILDVVPVDPALRLIGVHVGHLWVVAGFDLILPPLGAFGATSLLWLVLGWGCAALCFREAGARWWPALIAGFPFGMGLHQFRDVQWFTVEKPAVFGIALFCWALLRTRRTRGIGPILVLAAVFVGSTFLDVYLGLVEGALACLALVAARDRRMLAAVGASALAVLPLVLLQVHLLQGEGALADPEIWLWERAALDVASLWPPRWNHLEAWRALNLPLLALGAWGLWRDRRDPLARFAALGVVVLGLLALGPRLVGTRAHGIPNPFFLALWYGLPGAWRLAKPEFLLEAPVLLLLGSAARVLSGPAFGRRLLAVLHALLLAGWILSVRTHPAYPGFSQPVTVRLAPHWQDTLGPGAVRPLPDP